MTVLVASDGKNPIKERRFKLSMAICHGIPIVFYQWAEACMKKNQIIAPDSFQITDNDVNFDLSQSLEKKRDGWKIYISQGVINKKNSLPSREGFRAAANAIGASVVTLSQLMVHVKGKQEVSDVLVITNDVSSLASGTAGLRGRGAKYMNGAEFMDGLKLQTFDSTVPAAISESKSTSAGAPKPPVSSTARVSAKAAVKDEVTTESVSRPQASKPSPTAGGPRAKNGKAQTIEVQTEALTKDVSVQVGEESKCRTLIIQVEV